MDRDKAVTPIVGGKLRAGIKDQPQGCGVRPQQDLGRLGLGHQIGPLGAEYRIGIGSVIGIGPAEEIAFTRLRQKIRRQARPQLVALIDRDPELAGGGMEGQAFDIAQPVTKGVMVPSAPMRWIEASGRGCSDTSSRAPMVRYSWPLESTMMSRVACQPCGRRSGAPWSLRLKSAHRHDYPCPDRSPATPRLCRRYRFGHHAKRYRAAS